VTTDTEEDPADDTETAEATPADTGDIASRLANEKVIHYYNQALSYGVLVPNRNYYSGFGAQDDARHTLGFSTEGIPDTLADAQVRVYIYGSTELDELANSNFYQDPDTGDTYLKVDETYVRIESDDLESETLQLIIETIYT